MTAKMPDHDLWNSFLRDPDGNLIGLMEEKNRESEWVYGVNGEWKIDN